MKLDLGAGPVSPEGFMPVGRRHGSEIYPLPYADESVDEIRASHCLEHFPHAEGNDAPSVAKVLAEWVRVLKKGGRLRIAVPDFQKIAENYANGVPQLTEGYVMGGQTDADDFHKALFDEASLKQLFAASGLVLFRRWRSDIHDCAALPISLNLEGIKPHHRELKVSACMSVPRLGFMDNMFCSIEAFAPCGITKFRRCGGAYWAQAMTDCIEDTLAADHPDYVLTSDYDSIYTAGAVARLVQTAMCHPEADAIAAMQSNRHQPTALFTVKDKRGKNKPVVAIPRDAHVSPASTAHFGLTLLKAEKLATLKRPWFRRKPDKDGRWRDGRTDDDIGFWRNWLACGNSLYIAPRVVIGHLELVARWPGKDLQAVRQPVKEFNTSGPPKDIWQ